MNKLVIFTMLLTSFNSIAQKHRTINGLLINDMFAGETQLSVMAPNQYWILIIINSQLNTSKKVLSQLDKRQVDLSSTIIVNIGESNIKHKNPNKKQSMLTPNGWLKTQNISLLKQLNLSGTPVVLGLQNNTIKWQISGLAADSYFSKIANHINKWSAKGQKQ